MLRATGAAVLLVLVIVALVGCGPSSDLDPKAGECLAPYTTQTADGPLEGHTFVDCAQPHDQEVFLSFEMPNGPYPDLLEIGDAAQDECSSAFEDYVGVPWEESSYVYTFRAPAAANWPGDRTITCLLEDAAGGQLTGSARGTAR